MPTYEYHCRNCTKSFAVEAKMSDPAPVTAPGCQQETKSCAVEKKMSRVMGFVRGKAPQPVQTMVQETTVAPQPSYDPVHLCSKYCDHHAK